MDNTIIIPDEYKISFQRLVPYFPAALRDDPQALESVLLYLKVGGERLAHIAIEAYKQNHRLSYAEAQKRLREAALAADLANRLEEDNDNGDDDANDNGDDDANDNGDDDANDNGDDDANDNGDEDANDNGDDDANDNGDDDANDNDDDANDNDDDIDDDADDNDANENDDNDANGDDAMTKATMTTTLTIDDINNDEEG